MHDVDWQRFRLAALLDEGEGIHAEIVATLFLETERAAGRLLSTRDSLCVVVSLREMMDLLAERAGYITFRRPRRRGWRRSAARDRSRSACSTGPSRRCR